LDGTVSMLSSSVPFFAIGHIILRVSASRRRRDIRVASSEVIVKDGICAGSDGPN
jgi:hypothetical protein